MGNPHKRAPMALRPREFGMCEQTRPIVHYLSTLPWVATLPSVRTKAHILSHHARLPLRDPTDGNHMNANRHDVGNGAVAPLDISLEPASGSHKRLPMDLPRDGYLKSRTETNAQPIDRYPSMFPYATTVRRSRSRSYKELRSSHIQRPFPP